MSSLIGRDEGVFNPTLRFAFTNITAEDFVSQWGGVPVTVPAGTTIEISSQTPFPNSNGHCIANKMVDELVDKIMLGDAHLDEVSYRENGGQDKYYRSPKGSAAGVPAARKVWEDMIVQQLPEDGDETMIKTIRRNFQEELKGGIEGTIREESTIPTSVNEFADLLAKPAPKKPGRPAKIKEL